MKYVLQKGPDGITWCSLEPLMLDLKDSIVTLMELDLPPEEEEGRSQKLLGLKATYEVLGALVQEANLKEIRDATTH